MPAAPASRQLLEDAGWCAAYVVAVVLGRLTAAPEMGISLFWPAAGVAVVWLLVAAGRERLLRATGLLAAATYLVPVVFFGGSPVASVLFALGHVVHALVVRLVVTRAHDVSWDGVAVPDTTTVRGIGLLLRAAVIGTSVSAPFAVAGAWIEAGDAVRLVGLAWVVRNTTADLVLAAGWFQLVRWRAARGTDEASGALTAAPRPGARLELAALALTSAAVTTLLFEISTAGPLAFLMVATVTWTGGRFTPLVVSASSVLVGTAAIVLTLEGRGIFAQVTDPLERSISLQLFLGITTLAGALLAASTSERQRLSEGIAAVNDRFHRVLGRLEDFIWSVELLPDGRSVMLYSSDSIDPYTGATSPRTGDHWSAIATCAHPDDRGRLSEFGRRLAAGEAADVELRVCDHDGRTRWLWIRAAPRREDGHTYVDGITTDISQRMALDDIRNQFLAIAGHELRTPLTVIRGYAETLADEVANPRAARHAAAIERRAYQLELLISEFFDLAKFQSGQIQLSRAPVRLDEVVTEAVRDLAPTAGERGVRLEARTTPVTVSGDLVRIRQVVDNLLDNAIKYNHPLGSVVVSCGETDEMALLEVADTGIGVPRQELPQLFERFFRASNGQAHTITGTGLGLAVVKAIVDAHEGTVAAAGNDSGGLTVQLRLPKQGDVSAPDLSSVAVLK